MSLFRVLLGALVGSLLSSGLAIGFIYAGIQVAWWLALILTIIGFLISGYVAGFLAQDALPGLAAGFLTGIIAFGAIFLWSWLVLRNKLVTFYNDFNDIDQTVTALLGFLSIDETSALGSFMAEALKTKFSENSSNIDLLAQKYIPIFCLGISGVLGGCAVVNGSITGFIGGKWNKFDEIFRRDD